MEAADELTVLRIIVDALNNGDYDSDPAQWKALAKVAREQRHDWCTTQAHRSVATSDTKWGPV